MAKFQNVTYVIVFTNSSQPNVVLQGIRALAKFSSDSLYRVEGLNGRDLTELEIDEWERLTDLIFGEVETLPKGVG